MLACCLWTPVGPLAAILWLPLADWLEEQNASGPLVAATGPIAAHACWDSTCGRHLSAQPMVSLCPNLAIRRLGKALPHSQLGEEAAQG